MGNTTPALRLAIPCLGESQRLPAYLEPLLSLIEERALPMSIHVVDDGSPPEEQRALVDYVESLRSLHSVLLPPLVFPRNRGKGRAIRESWDSHGSEPWLAFADADGAISPEETLRLLAPAFDPKTPPSLFCAVRNQGGSKGVHRRLHRALGARIFNLWTRLCLGLPMRDTQCGLKMLPRTFHEGHAANWREDGFAFDLELLLAARTAGLPLNCVDVAWTEKGGSRLGIAEALQLFGAAWRLRRIRDCGASRSP